MSLSIKHKLKIIGDYYEAARQCGHTTAMLSGAHNVPQCVVVTAGEATVTTSPHVECLPLSNLRAFDSNIRGKSKSQLPPMLVDNAAMHTLCREAVAEMNKRNEAAVFLMLELTLAKARLAEAYRELETTRRALGAAQWKQQRTAKQRRAKQHTAKVARHTA